MPLPRVGYVTYQIAISLGSMRLASITFLLVVGGPTISPSQLSKGLACPTSALEDPLLVLVDLFLGFRLLVAWDQPRLSA